MPAGGRRLGAGHPTQHEQTVKRDSGASAAAVEQRVLHASYEEFLEAAKYLAKGQQVVGCRRCIKTLKDCNCPKPDRGMVYLKPPDKDMLRLVIEKIGGKASAAPQVQQETSIVVVPRFERPPMPGDVHKEDAAEEEADDGQL